MITTAMVTPVTNRECDWAVPDRHGYEQPHGIQARYRIEGAGEIYDGDFCALHAIEAALAALNEERLERALG